MIGHHLSAHFRISGFYVFVLIGLLVILTGCPSNVIEGTVMDVKGDTLPGVVVSVAGTGSEVVTNTLGKYKIGYVPGTIQLKFAKTGYTPGELDLGVITSNIPAVPVTLWPLPQNRGVFIFDNNRYYSTTNFEPQSFITEKIGSVYGSRKIPETITYRTEPMIVCYKMIRSGISCSRLEKRSVKPIGLGSKSPPIEIIVPTATITIEQVPIDEPEHRLVQLRFAESLKPGMYAIHWGALRGYTTTDKRIFTFIVANSEVIEENGIADSTTEQGNV